MYIKYGWYDYSAFCSRRIGVRWHSQQNRKYYEHIVRNADMELEPLSWPYSITTACAGVFFFLF